MSTRIAERLRECLSSPLFPSQVWEKVAADLLTNDERIVTYKGIPWQTTQGPCTVKSLKSAKIG
eukprot:scaffold7205_cov523-Prasinococcus_capsulatus_cf.AAC.7